MSKRHELLVWLLEALPFALIVALVVGAYLVGVTGS